MKQYTVTGNVITVQFRHDAPAPQSPDLQVVDWDLLSYLYDECAEIARLGKNKNYQTIYVQKNVISPKQKTTVWQYAKKELKKIEKMEYIEKMQALQHLYTVTQVFWMGAKLYRDEVGDRIHALDQISQEVIEEQMRIVNGTRDLWEKKLS